MKTLNETKKKNIFWKFAAIVTALAFAVLLAACSGGNKNGDNGNDGVIEDPEITGISAEPRMLIEGEIAANAEAVVFEAVGGTAPFGWVLDSSGGKGADNDKFDLGAVTGILTVKEDGSALTEGEYKVQVKVTDSKQMSFTREFTITVQPSGYTPPPPSNLDFAPASPLAAPVPPGTTVGTFSADVEATPATYSLVPGEGGGDNGLFTLDGNVLKAAAELSNGTYNFRVRVSDKNDEYDEKSFFVFVEPDPSVPPPSSTVDNAADLEEYLKSLPPNTVNNPYPVVWTGGNLDVVEPLLLEYKRYVHLDISGSDWTGWNATWGYFQTNADDWPHDSYNKGWEYLAGITLPDSVTHLSGGVFNSSYTITTVIMNGVTHTAYGTFQRAYSLANVQMNSIQEIGGNSFYHVSIAHLILPDSLTQIGGTAFGDSTILQSLSLPPGVNIADGAFSQYTGCQRLVKVTFRGPATFGASFLGDLADVYHAHVSAGGELFPVTFLTDGPLVSGTAQWRKETFHTDIEGEDPGITPPASWNTGTAAGKTPIPNPEVIPLNVPVAGNYPQGMYRYPFKIGQGGTYVNELFYQTVEWFPAIRKTFVPNTEYIAVITLEPKDGNRTLRGTAQSAVQGLPANGYKSITAEAVDDSIKIYISFNMTAGVKAEPQMLFEDDFGGSELDLTKWERPEADRQGRSRWDRNMVSVSGGNLSIKLQRAPELGENWIRTGAVQTKRAEPPHLPYNGPVLFENSYGYYEARMKLPVVESTWGAFWLMTNTMMPVNHGKIGTEIDIIESINNHRGEYNSALHWGDYDTPTYNKTGFTATDPVTRINIYDGEYHVFALDWSPSEYVFYIDGQEFWRTDGGEKDGNPGINQNPNFVMFSVEAADWAGTLPANFTEAEMLVDWVRVWNQPRN